jgi:uridine kinase
MDGAREEAAVFGVVGACTRPCALPAAHLYDFLVFPGHHEHVTEAEYDVVTRFRDLSGVDELPARIAELRNRLGRGVSVGISGIDCSGKSTLADSLRRELGELGLPALVISGDEFTRPTAERYSEPDEALGYYRNSFDYGWLSESLLPAVRVGFEGELTATVSDWERDGWKAHTLRLELGSIVIVEGCFLFTDQLAPRFDLLVWLELSTEQAVERAMRRPRDLERMGGEDGVRERYARRYLAGQRLHLDRDRPQQRADVVLPGEWPRSASGVLPSRFPVSEPPSRTLFTNDDLT